MSHHILIPEAIHWINGFESINRYLKIYIGTTTILCSSTIFIFVIVFY